MLMQKTHHHSGRKALQPKIINTNSPKPDHAKRCLPPPIDNKENIPPNCYNKDCSSPIDSQQDASLADELIAIRQKLDRLRVDKEKTEKMLNERVVMLDLKMKDIIRRGDVQKQLENEVDRLYRLNEIRLSCLRISPIRTLRDKEQERKIKQEQFKANIEIQEYKAEEASTSGTNKPQSN